ncbi:MAG: hypothetical protein V4467_00395 [Patescibacteria group bacterium]
MNPKKRWYILEGVSDGEIFAHQLMDGLPVGMGISEKTSLAKEIGAEQTVIVLVVCTPIQEKLLDALLAIDRFGGDGSESFLFELVGLIRAARKRPRVYPVRADLSTISE